MGSILFSPFRMRSVEFHNRIMISPMGQCSSVDGFATDWHLMHLGGLAIAGAGSLVVEAIAIHPQGRNSPADLGIWSDAHAEALRPALQFCRAHSDTAIGFQLWHAGRKGSVTVSWERQELIPIERGGWEVFGASGIPYGHRATPTALSEEQIASTIEDFVAAARRADRLGIDFLEIHGAHGYLIHNFLSPLSNKRNDGYGGDLEGRMRFALEVYRAVRKVWPEQKPIGMRISASDWCDGGWTLDDSVQLARRLREEGCDYITASSGGAVPEQKLEVHPGYQVPFADRIRHDGGIPTVAVGLITEPREAEDVLQRGCADLIALGRGMLYNPRWPWHAALELQAEPRFPPQYERAHPAMRTGDFLKPLRDA